MTGPTNEVVRAIHSGQLVRAGTGSNGTEYTVTLIGDEGLIDPDPNNNGGNAAQLPGDVLSVQPDGALQCRRKGTAGAYECCLIDGNAVVFAPNGTSGPAFRLLYSGRIPNA